MHHAASGHPVHRGFVRQCRLPCSTSSAWNSPSIAAFRSSACVTASESRVGIDDEDGPPEGVNENVVGRLRSDAREHEERSAELRGRSSHQRFPAAGVDVPPRQGLKPPRLHPEGPGRPYECLELRDGPESQDLGRQRPGAPQRGNRLLGVAPGRALGEQCAGHHLERTARGPPRLRTVRSGEPVEYRARRWNRILHPLPRCHRHEPGGYGDPDHGRGPGRRPRAGVQEAAWPDRLPTLGRALVLRRSIVSHRDGAGLPVIDGAAVPAAPNREGRASAATDCDGVASAAVE